MSTNIAVAGFHHETNTFAPAQTPYAEFEKDDGWPGLVLGADVISRLRPLNLGLGGFIEAAEHCSSPEVQLLPLIWTNAEPYGCVTEDAYERIARIIVEGVAAIKSLDAIYLCMHGAMVPEHYQDGEGELLRRLRKVVGPELPIVMSLDLHANITPAMFELSDGITIFRTYPHVDMAATGQRAFTLLQSILNSQTRPAKAFYQVPFLLPLTAQHTGSSPCKELYASVAERQAQLLSLDFACGFPPADIHHCGASVVSYAQNAQDAEQAARKLLDQVIAAREQFTADLVEADDAVLQAIGRGTPGLPVVIADAHDNPGAGGSGDTTGLIESLVRQQAAQAIVGCVWDPDAAQQAYQAGIGATIEVALGGRNGPEGVQPFRASFKVEALSDGRFTCHGPMMKGTELKLGQMALLSVRHERGDVKIAVASERSQCLDQAMFRTLDVEPSEQAIVVVKSAVHFRNDFEQIAADVIVASSPGANPCRPSDIPYRNLRPELMASLETPVSD